MQISRRSRYSLILCIIITLSSLPLKLSCQDTNTDNTNTNTDTTDTNTTSTDTSTTDTNTQTTTTTTDGATTESVTVGKPIYLIHSWKQILNRSDRRKKCFVGVTRSITYTRCLSTGKLIIKTPPIF